MDALTSIAERLLEAGPGPAVRLLLLRDVLHRPPADPDLQHAQQELEGSRWVRQLADEQRPDGSWSRLHSQDTAAPQTTTTTEFAVERALALGLPPTHPMLRRAAAHLTQVLRTGRCPDPPERNDRWATGVQLFAAGTLALLQPRSSALDPAWNLWLEIATQTLAGGRYDPAAEIEVHRQLTGATVKDSYLALGNKYQLALLSARPEALPPTLARALLAHVTGRPGGMGYLSEPLFRPPPPRQSSRADRWLSSWELLARFPAWRETAGEAMRWLWEQQWPDGTWDFGPRPARSIVVPLSDSWRKPGSGRHDWTARILALLARYHHDDLQTLPQRTLRKRDALRPPNSGPKRSTV